MRPSLVPALLAALGACACAATPTEIVVAVDVDVPLQPITTWVRARTLGEDGVQLAAHDFEIRGPAPVALPFSFVMRPRGSAASAVHLELSALGPDRDVLVARSIRTRFRAAERRLLVVHLESACRGVPCTVDAETCVGGRCTTDSVETLPGVEPGRELFDGGTDPAGADAAMSDGSQDDAGAGLPQSCDALAAVGASDGVYTVDPDGEGASEPIDVRCRFEAGRGWTLLVKTVSGQMLGFEAPPWSTSALVNPEDLSLAPADALLRSYARAPVSELSIQLTLDETGRELVVPVALGRTATLHAILSSGTRIDTPGSEAGWAAMIGMESLPPACAVGLNLVSARTKVRIGAICDAAGAVNWGWVGVGGETLGRCGSGMPVRIGSGGLACADGMRNPRRASTLVWGR